MRKIEEEEGSVLRHKCFRISKGETNSVEKPTKFTKGGPGQVVVASVPVVLASAMIGKLTFLTKLSLTGQPQSDTNEKRIQPISPIALTHGLPSLRMKNGAVLVLKSTPVPLTVKHSALSPQTQQVSEEETRQKITTYQKDKTTIEKQALIHSVLFRPFYTAWISVTGFCFNSCSSLLAFCSQ